MAKSNPEDKLAIHIKALRLLEPEREYRFDTQRKWRIDFAWPTLKLAAEVEGGTRPWKKKNGKIVRGRHVTPEGFEKDCEKYNTLAARGWSVFRFTTAMVDDGRAIDALSKFIRASTY